MSGRALVVKKWWEADVDQLGERATFQLQRAMRDSPVMKQMVLLLVSLAFPMSASAQSDLEAGFSGALRGCEEWVLNPDSWAHGTGAFTSAVGLGDKMGLVQSVDEAALPPPALRAGSHYWRINSTPTAGYILVVSDRLPICHITGGGAADLEPVVAAVLASADFKKNWIRTSDASHGDMASTEFRNSRDQSLSIVISRASKPGQRQDRVQVLATASYQIGKGKP